MKHKLRFLVTIPLIVVLLAFLPPHAGAGEERPEINTLVEVLGWSEIIIQAAIAIDKENFINRIQKEYSATPKKRREIFIQIYMEEMDFLMSSFKKKIIAMMSKIMSPNEARFLTDLLLLKSGKKTLTKDEMKELKDFLSSNNGILLSKFQKTYSDFLAGLESQKKAFVKRGADRLEKWVKENE